MTTANPAWDSLPPARTHIRTMQQACGYPRPRSHRSAGRPARAARCSTENKTTPPPPGHTRTHAHAHTHTRTHECPPLAASCRLPAAPPVSRHKGAPAGSPRQAAATPPPPREGPGQTAPASLTWTMPAWAQFMLPQQRGWQGSHPTRAACQLPAPGNAARASAPAKAHHSPAAPAATPPRSLLPLPASLLPPRRLSPGTGRTEPPTRRGGRPAAWPAPQRDARPGPALASAPGPPGDCRQRPLKVAACSGPQPGPCAPGSAGVVPTAGGSAPPSALLSRSRLPLAHPQVGTSPNAEGRNDACRHRGRRNKLFSPSCCLPQACSPPAGTLPVVRTLGWWLMSSPLTHEMTPTLQLKLRGADTNQSP